MKGCGNVLWPCLSTQILLSRLAIGVGSRAAAAEVVQCTQACKRVSGAVRNIMYPLLAKLEMYSEIRTMESFVVAPAPPLDDLCSSGHCDCEEIARSRLCCYPATKGLVAPC